MKIGWWTFDFHGTQFFYIACKTPRSSRYLANRNLLTRPIETWDIPDSGPGRACIQATATNTSFREKPFPVYMPKTTEW